jgi:REP element-mobilizing transposase RayT
MARQPRLHVEGGVYHVILRGNGGQNIFFSIADRRFFYDLIAEGCRRFGYRVHGFCLMRNHVHLIVEVGATPLSRPMQNLSFRYGRWINRREGHSGHLFQGRFRALLIEADSYLLELVRYVHLNPVRADLVEAAEDYPWSGHRAYLGLEKLPWLTTERVLGQFDRHEASARAHYRAFVRGGSAAGHRDEFHRGADDSRVLGSAAFLESVLRPPAGPETAPGQGQTPGLGAIVDRVCARYGLGADELAGPGRRRLCSEARGVIGHLARGSAAASLSEVARRFNRDLTTMSRAVRRVEVLAARDSAFAGRLAADLNAITQS